MDSDYAILDNVLTRPSAAQFDASATICYMSSGINVKTPAKIEAHLKKCLQDISHKRLLLKEHATERSAVFEVASEIAFVQGQAWVVPGIDMQFCIDQIVHVMTVYILTFVDSKISSIRVYWDQATVLKQLGVLGSRSSFPIQDGQLQIQMVKGLAVTTNKVCDSGQSVAKHQAPVSPTKGVNARLNVFRETTPEPQTEYTQESVRKPNRPVTTAHEYMQNNNNNNDDEQRKPLRQTIEIPAKSTRNFSFSKLAEQEPITKHEVKENMNMREHAHHFDLGGDDGNNNNNKTVSIEQMHKNRRDMDTHFSFDHEASSPIKRSSYKAINSGREHNDRHFTIEDNSPKIDKDKPSTGVNHDRRDMERHWAFSDDSTAEYQNMTNRSRAAGGNRKLLTRTWELGYD